MSPHILSACVRPRVPKDTPLPSTFEPGPCDVICGRNRLEAYRSSGNRRFRLLILCSLQHYQAVTTKTEKSLVVASIMDIIRSNGGRFVKSIDEANYGLNENDRNETSIASVSQSVSISNSDTIDKGTDGATSGLISRRWVDIGDNAARDKVGHTLRHSMPLVDQQDLALVDQNGYALSADTIMRMDYNTLKRTEDTIRKMGHGLPSTCSTTPSQGVVEQMHVSINERAARVQGMNASTVMKTTVYAPPATGMERSEYDVVWHGPIHLCSSITLRIACGPHIEIDRTVKISPHICMQPPDHFLFRVCLTHPDQFCGRHHRQHRYSRQSFHPRH